MIISVKIIEEIINEDLKTIIINEKDNIKYRKNLYYILPFPGF